MSAKLSVPKTQKQRRFRLTAGTPRTASEGMKIATPGRETAGYAPSTITMPPPASPKETSETLW